MKPMSTALPLSSCYQVGGSLDANNPTYVPRQADNDFYNYLNKGEFCYVLTARQMGKSSLRVRTMKKLQEEGTVCAALDLTLIGSDHIPQSAWYRALFYELTKEFGIDKTFNRVAWWKKHDSLTHIQRLNLFIQEILLTSISEKIAIFIDEIDSIKSLDFSTDDFFAFIRACYNLRIDKPEYKRLTFALLGVATPSDLIADRERTPFNIGQAIELSGFEFEKSKHLALSLSKTDCDSEILLKEVLFWTGGQPFLTQKLFNLISSSSSSITYGIEAEFVAQLVQSNIVENWEFQDNPEHLKTIKYRILNNEKLAAQGLGLYQKILQNGTVLNERSPEQRELQISGIIAKKENCLVVYNPIYEKVFDLEWITKELKKLRPYSENLKTWFNSSCQDESQLLRGKNLKKALIWKNGKNLSIEDEQFLDASQELEKRELERALEIKEEESRILVEANFTLNQAQKKAKRIIRFGSLGLMFISIFSLATIAITSFQLKKMTSEHYSSLLNNAQKDFHIALRQNYWEMENDSVKRKIKKDRRLKQLQQSLKDFDTILEINYRSEEIYFYQGLLHERIGDVHYSNKDSKKAADSYQKAADFYQKAAHRNKEAAYHRLARLYLQDKIENKTPKDAIQLLEKRLVHLNQIKDPELKYDIHKNLGWAYWKNNQYSQAEKYLKEAIKVDQKNQLSRAPAYCILADLLEEKSDNIGKSELYLSKRECSKHANPLNSSEETEWRKDSY